MTMRRPYASLLAFMLALAGYQALRDAVARL